MATKATLIKRAEGKGLTVPAKATKADIEQLLASAEGDGAPPPEDTAEGKAPGKGELKRAIIVPGPDGGPNFEAPAGTKVSELNLSAEAKERLERIGAI